MLARWYMLLCQFSVTFEYCPGAQYANADGMSRQCGQCMMPGCPVEPPDSRVDDVDSTTALLDQPFTSSKINNSKDADLLPELSGETWVAATYMDEPKADLPTTGSDLDLVVASRQDVTLATVHKWVQSGAAPAWSECLGLSPELRCWRLQVGNLSAFRNMTYRPSDYATPIGEFGVPQNHPRFLEWIGVPESASLLDIGPGMWLHSLSRDQAMDAALQLHKDVCLITTNLDVLDQYVLCLQGMALKILKLGLGSRGFPSEEVAAVPWDPGSAAHLYKWRP